MSRRDPAPKPKRLSVTIPERAGPHVKLVFAEMQRQGFTYDELAWQSGVLRPTLKAWRLKNAPSLQNIEAALGVLGFDFVPIPREKAIPKEIAAELKPIAERLGLSMAATTQFLFEIVSGVHQRVEAAPKPKAPLEQPAKRARRGFIHPDQESFFNAAA